MRNNGTTNKIGCAWGWMNYQLSIIITINMIIIIIIAMIKKIFIIIAVFFFFYWNNLPTIQRFRLHVSIVKVTKVICTVMVYLSFWFGFAPHKSIKLYNWDNIKNFKSEKFKSFIERERFMCSILIFCNLINIP
jgi:hypothetical protein